MIQAGHQGRGKKNKINSVSVWESRLKRNKAADADVVVVVYGGGINNKQHEREKTRQGFREKVKISVLCPNKSFKARRL